MLWSDGLESIPSDIQRRRCTAWTGHQFIIGQTQGQTTIHSHVYMYVQFRETSYPNWFLDCRRWWELDLFAWGWGGDGVNHCTANDV